MTSPSSPCKYCQRSSLSLLLLRPSPIALRSELQPVGAANTRADDSLTQALIPPGLTASRPVLRLLRSGYVHLYIPATKVWRSWQVTPQGDLLAHDHPAFSIGEATQTCTRPEHDSSGFKLLQIPQAHELMGQSIWLAFSANLWSDKLKAQNEANPQAMQEVKLGSVGPQCFKPDAASLKRQVLECNVSHWRMKSLNTELEPQFGFKPLCSTNQIEHLAQTLQKAAACHPQTAGHELAVVLPDPLGYAAELNGLRLMAEQHGAMLSEGDAHKLHSHFALKGIVNNVADMRAYNNLAPIMSQPSYEALKRNSPASMEGAYWERLCPTQRPHPQDKGRVWTAKTQAQLTAQRPKFQALAKKEIEDGYDPVASQTWVQALQDRTLKALEPFERQWLLARDHHATAQYFVMHFDDQDPNRPGHAQTHSPGRLYAQEFSLIDGPAPKASVALLDIFVAAYFKPLSSPQSVALRALVANQATLFPLLTDALSGDPNVEASDGGGMRDKSVDFIKGLLDFKGDHFKLKYSWLTDATMTFAIGPMSHLAAAASTYISLEGSNALAKRPKVAALAMNAAAWVGGMNTALKSAMGQRVVRPVLVNAWIELGLVNRAILGPNGEFEGWEGARPGGRQLVTVLTDTERLAKGPAELQALLASTDGAQVAHGRGAGAALAAKATGAIVLDAATGLTPYQGEALFAHQVEEARKIGGTIRAAIPQGAKAVVMSVDGRLALASVIVQIIGISNGRRAVAKAKDELGKATAADRAAKEKTLSDAQLGLYDSLGGLVAGGLDTLRVAGEAMNVHRGAAAGPWAVRSIGMLKFGASAAGTFGGALNAYVSYMKAGEAYSRGQFDVMGLHVVSMLSFGATGVTAFAPIASSGLSYIATTRIAGEVIRGAATRLAAATVAGGWVPVAGWVLLGVGIAATVGAAIMEPTKLEAWARQTPFGKGPEAQKFKTIVEQNKALNIALGLAADGSTTGSTPT